VYKQKHYSHCSKITDIIYLNIAYKICTIIKASTYQKKKRIYYINVIIPYKLNLFIIKIKRMFACLSWQTFHFNIGYFRKKTTNIIYNILLCTIICIGLTLLKSHYSLSSFTCDKITSNVTLLFYMFCIAITIVTFCLSLYVTRIILHLYLFVTKNFYTHYLDWLQPWFHNYWQSIVVTDNK